jgi:hypothetical protein
VSATVLLAIGVAGVLLNGFLVWITVRNKFFIVSSSIL